MKKQDGKSDIEKKKTAGLAREIEPAADLWPGIARRIDPTAAHTSDARASSALPRDIEPVRDLWPAVRRRIEGAGRTTADATEPRRAGVSWVGWTGWAVATAALILAFQVPGSLDEAPVPAEGDRLATRTGTIGLPIEQASTGRLEARTRLLRVLAEDSSVSPATRAIVERNLATIDEALAEIQQALASDPGNATIYRLLHATYRQEAIIVAQMTRRGHGREGSL